MTRARSSAVAIAPIASALFNYDVLDPAAASKLRELSSYVRAGVRCAGHAMLEIGWALNQAKAQLPHGQFGPWLAAEFAWTERTARNYMQAAEVFGENRKLVSDLPAATIYRLAAPSTPEPVRAEVLQRLEGGEQLPPKRIEALIAEARAERRTQPSTRAEASPQAIVGGHQAAAFIVERMGALSVEMLILLLEADGIAAELVAELGRAAGLDLVSDAPWRERARQRLDGDNRTDLQPCRNFDKVSAPGAVDAEPELPAFLDRRGHAGREVT